MNTPFVITYGIPQPLQIPQQPQQPQQQVAQQGNIIVIQNPNIKPVFIPTTTTTTCLFPTITTVQNGCHYNTNTVYGNANNSNIRLVSNIPVISNGISTRNSTLCYVNNPTMNVLNGNISTNQPGGIQPIALWDTNHTNSIASNNIPACNMQNGLLMNKRSLIDKASETQQNGNKNIQKLPNVPINNKNQSSKNTDNIFKCGVCDKVFKRKTNLNAHAKIHTDYAYLCPYCGKKFARNGNLKQHLRIHTNERPFSCKYCSKSFRQKHSLYDHERTHTGEKPFGCKYCSMRFAARCNLIVHERTHTGMTPYFCKQCKKKYASKSGLNAHLRKFHQ